MRGSRRHKFRTAHRMRQIATLFVELELFHFIEAFGLHRFLPLHKKLGNPKDHPFQTQPETIRKIFERLGGAFLKLGQLLALRPDLVGIEYSKEFEKLLQTVPVTPWQEVQSVLESCLPDHKTIFSRFDTTPVASGSVAQVYRARLLSGKEVAVKIKRPGVDILFEEDIDVMYTFARIIEARYGREVIDPVAIVDEFKSYTLKELDLLHELRNLERFAENFKDHSSIRIPVPFKEYCSKDLLVMEYLKGQNVLEYKRKHSKSVTTDRWIVKTVTDAVYKQLFLDGFFHADLHPGNVFVLSSHKLAFIDFGIVGFIDRGLRIRIRNLFIALVDGKLHKTAIALAELNTSRIDIDSKILEEGLYHALSDYYNVPLDKMPITKMLSDSIEVARKAHLRMPAQVVLFSKSLLTLEGFCREIDPSFNIVKSARPYIKKMLTTELELRKVPQDLLVSSLEFKRLFFEIPQTVSSFSRKIGILEERILDIDKTFHYLSNVIWRVSTLVIYTILFAAILISSSTLINLEPQFKGVSLYFVFGSGFCLMLLGFIISTIRKEIPWR